jgi:biotin operon repressor
MNKPTFPFEIEHDIRRAFTSPTDRVITALVIARRVAGKAGGREFYLGESLTASLGLSPSQVWRVLKRLEGKLVRSVGEKRGRHRRLVFLPDYDVDAPDT